MAQSGVSPVGNEGSVLVTCRMQAVELLCAGLCFFGVETIESKASHLMTKSSISQRLVMPGAGPLASQTDPAFTPNILKRMFVGSAFQKQKKRPSRWFTLDYQNAATLISAWLIVKIKPTPWHCPGTASPTTTIALSNANTPPSIVFDWWKNGMLTQGSHY